MAYGACLLPLRILSRRNRIAGFERRQKVVLGKINMYVITIYISYGYERAQMKRKSKRTNEHSLFFLFVCNSTHQSFHFQHALTFTKHKLNDCCCHHVSSLPNLVRDFMLILLNYVLSLSLLAQSADFKRKITHSQPCNFFCLLVV